MSNKIAYIIELQNRFSAQAKRVAKSMKHIQNTAIGARSEFRKLGSAATSTFNTIEKRATRAGIAIDGLQKKAQKTTASMRKRIGAGGRNLRNAGLEGLAYATPVMYQVKRSLDVSSEVEEVQQKYGHVFGTTQGIQERSDVDIKELAKYADESENKVREMFTSFGTFLTGQGFKGDKVADMSKDLGLFAQELTVFHNMPSLMDTGDRLTRGLMGETESLKALGIIVRQDDPAFQRRMKLMARSQRITMSQARSQLILNEIMRQGQYALGHTTREMGNYATVLRRTSSQLYDTQAAFGEVFKEDASDLILSIKGFLETLEFMDPEVKRLIVNITLLTGAFLALAVVVGILGIIAAGIMAPFGLIIAKILLLGAVFVGVVSVLSSVFQFIGDGLRWIGELIGWDGLANYGGNEWDAPSTPGKFSENESLREIKGNIKIAADKGTNVSEASIFWANLGVNLAEAI